MTTSLKCVVDANPIAFPACPAILDEKSTATAMTENQPKHTEVEMHFHQGVHAAAGKVEGDMIVNPRQSLADSAAEIQQLLQLLERSYPADLPAETQAEIDVAVKAIDRDPALRERVVGALRAGGVEALRELIDNPYVNILLAAYEGWRTPNP